MLEALKGGEIPERRAAGSLGGVVRFKQPSWYESVLEDVTSAIPFGTVLNKLEASIARLPARKSAVPVSSQAPCPSGPHTNHSRGNGSRAEGPDDDAY